jgi:hypothetical protein
MTKRVRLHLLAKPKLHLTQSVAWPEHRHGWAFVESTIASHLCCDDGTIFISSIEERLYNAGPVETPWVGVVHQVPRHSLPRYPDLERLLQRDDWTASLPHCLGLWTLCDYTRRFLIAKGVSVPVGVLPYITPHDVMPFDWKAFEATLPRQVLHIGQYQRNFQTFFDLEAPGWKKLLLKPPKWEMRSTGVAFNGSVEILDRLDGATYDSMLSRSIVALDLRDAGANTTIVECMARATPVCVNNVGGIAEYLGSAYPLYHHGNIGEILQDEARLRAAHAYLEERRPGLPAAADFCQAMQSSAVYVSLPVPPSQTAQFRRFEVTVLIAVFARIGSLRDQLDGFVRQADAPDFEIVLWNNDPRNTAELSRIAQAYRPRLTIRVIDCSDNIYCGMRMAMPALARSDTVIVCDDDVLPSPHYLRRMFDAHRALGPEGVLCLRGHVIHDHHLSEDDPERAWATEEHMTFHDQAAPEREVHFAHADNLVISVDLLRRAALYPMTHPEYVLVDDYWLSYVLGSRLGVRIHKLQAPDLMTFTPSADDPDVALYHNPLVHEQRVRLYIEHMRAGWPARSAETAPRSASETRAITDSGMPTKEGR